ncbi:MAG TPA: helix-turn-helix domain-containing protein [Armatimonadota bacterium]|jgi:repressor LexA
MPPYTPKQGQYLAFIAAYMAKYGRSPAEADIHRHFMVSPPSVHQMILTLEARGFISRTPGTARSIKVLLPVEELPPFNISAKQRVATFEERYPTVAAWVTTQGWIELGSDDNSRSMVRALDEGGMVWEGKNRYATLDALFTDLENHLIAWQQG